MSRLTSLKICFHTFLCRLLLKSENLAWNTEKIKSALLGTGEVSCCDLADRKAIL